VCKEASGEGRIISLKVAFDIPYDTFVGKDYGHQSLEYIDPWQLETEVGGT